jgi:hypothetical protein
MCSQPCTSLLCQSCPQGLLHWRYKHAQFPFCWARPRRPTHPCTIFTLQACASKACQAGDPHTHNLCSARLCPPKPVKPGIHRHTGSLLCQLVPFKHAKPMLQRPATSPHLKASTRRPVGPHPRSTCHRKAPNLPKRHTQRGLDAKELASEPLRLQIYCLRTGEFFYFSYFNFYFFPFFKGFAACFTN